MKKSKEQKRKEADFRKIRGDIVDSCRNFKSMLEYYDVKNFDEPEKQPSFISEKKSFRSILLVLIKSFETYEKYLKQNAFDGWSTMDEELKELFIKTYKDISEEEKLFFSYF